MNVAPLSYRRHVASAITQTAERAPPPACGGCVTTASDPDAIEINRLFCKANEALGFNPLEEKVEAPVSPEREPTVTDTQNFSKEISDSRNDEATPSRELCCG